MSDYLKKPTNSGRDCPFCHGPEHYGMCEELRLAQEKAAAELKPVPNPRVRN
jgi:hypothetical protein